MNRRIFAPGLALVAAAMASTTSADFIEEPAFYGGAGYAETRFDDDGQLRGFEQDDDDSGIHLFGGYRFNRYLAAEASLRDLGSFSANQPGVRYRQEFSSLTVGVVGQLPLGDHVSLYARVGAGVITLDERVSTPDYRDSDDDSGGTSMLGVGVELRPMGEKGPALRLGWETHLFTVESTYLVDTGSYYIVIEDEFDQRIDSVGLDLAWYF